MTPTTPSAQTSARRRARVGRSVLLRDVDWEMYEQLLDVFRDRKNARLTYDRGDLEIMAPSNEHEEDAENLGMFVNLLTEEYRLPVRRGGSVTLRRKRLRRGLEPDRCFWIANAANVAGIRKIDLETHPAPDLAIEVDVTSRSIDKFRIYSKLGVAELWNLAGDELRFFRLGPDRKYAEVSVSPTFPGVTPADLMTFLKQIRGAADQNIATIAFRAWVRQRVAAGLTPPPASAG